MEYNQGPVAIYGITWRRSDSSCLRGGRAAKFLRPDSMNGFSGSGPTSRRTGVVAVYPFEKQNEYAYALRFPPNYGYDAFCSNFATSNGGRRQSNSAEAISETPAWSYLETGPETGWELGCTVQPSVGLRNFVSGSTRALR